MHAMRNGLKWAEFLDLNCQYPEKTRPLFVHCGCELIYDQIKALLCSAPPSQPVEKRGYEWLYIAECAPLSGTICVSLCVYHCQFDMLGLRSLHSGNESYSL